MEGKFFTHYLLKWYEINGRELPWRHTKDPYKIWLSEVILQQTRVAQGMPYYHKFVEAFPTVKALATASETSVLRLWQGLGYYSRARNLHMCAKIIHSERDDIFPSHYTELLKLPGIGRYTAAAIASFCFGEKVPVVDGNVYRVLARVFGMYDDIAQSKTYDVFYNHACTLIPGADPGSFNQALMEYGAMHCTPHKPDCEVCVFKGGCYAYAHDAQEDLPVKTKKVKVKKRYFHYLVVRQGDSLLMKRRNGKDIWHGLYDFALLESGETMDIDSLEESSELLQTLKPQARNIIISQEYKHVLSHQRIFGKFFDMEIPADSDISKHLDSQELAFYTREEVAELPKPVLISRYLNESFF